MLDNKTTIDQLKKEVVHFRDERAWKKYHKPKDLAIAISVEVAELMEPFCWKSETEIIKMLKDQKEFQEVSYEMADIFIFLLSFSDILGIDISSVIKEKLVHNRKKYPKEKMKKLSEANNNEKKFREMKKIKLRYRVNKKKLRNKKNY